MQGIIRSEWTKFYSYPWCMAGAIGALFTAPIVLLVMGGVSGETVISAQDLTAQCLRSLFLGQAGIVVAAAGFFGQEYEQSCLRTTFLAVPQRAKTIGVKWIVLTVVVVVVGMVSGMFCLAVGVAWYHCDVPIQTLADFMASDALAMISWVQIAWISAGLSMLTKAMVTPIAVLLPLILSLSQILNSFFKPAQYLPDLATMNLFLTPRVTAFLGVYLGIAVQFIWVLLFGVTAFWLTLRRDVR